MRSMTIFNYLLEATVIGSALILLVIAVRALLRDHLGSRAVYAAWLVAALRLLVPLSLPNPAMDEFRPGLSADVAARPVADQVRRRVIDAGYDMASLLSDGENSPLRIFAAQTRGGYTGKWVLILWIGVAAGVGAWMIARSLRFLRRVRHDRVRPLDGGELAQFEALCRRYRIAPPPVYYVDRLSRACLVGVTRPFIALPLDVPREHISLVLAHELCHRRAHDPFWSLVRSLCCALHWFNPLVWLAACLSKVDCEMACDDRVTAKLQDMDRLAYANAIVSTAGRDGNAPRLHAAGATLAGKHLRQRITAIIRCVRGSRWAVAIGSLAAAAVLLASFATSESEPLPTVRDIPAVSWTAAAAPLENGDEAIACARRFLESPFIGENTAAYAFTASRSGAQWRVEARTSLDSLPIVLRFSRDGYLLEYDGTRALSGLSFTDTSYTHRTFTDSVDGYISAFMTALVPGQTWKAGRATADVRAGRVRLLDGVLSDSEGQAVCQLTLQVEPDARVLYYLSYTPDQANG